MLTIAAEVVVTIVIAMAIPRGGHGNDSLECFIMVLELFRMIYNDFRMLKMLYNDLA